MTEHKQFEEIAKNLTRSMEKELDEKRFRHTISVAHTASALAMRYGTDPYQAYLAGLLHDCAKCLSHDKKKELCKKYNIVLNDAEKKNPELIHAKLGSCLAKHKYDIDDEEILSAIRYHTTGRPKMSVLEKIIYIADYIEVHRRMLVNMEEVRGLAFLDLDACMTLILEGVLMHLNDKACAIDKMTQATYEYYKTCKEGVML